MLSERSVLFSIADRQRATNKKVELANAQRRTGVTDLSSNEYIRTINTGNPFVQDNTGGADNAGGAIDIEGNAGYAANWFKQHDKDATNQGIAAILGNWQIESTFDFHAIQGGLAYNEQWAMSPSVGGYAFGIAQWDAGRRVNLINYARGMGKDWFDKDAQLLFAYGGEGSDSQIFQEILHSDASVADLTSQFVTRWERAGVPNLQSRINAANDIYQKLSSSSEGGKNGLSTSFLDQNLGRVVNGGQCYGLAQFWYSHFGGGTLNTSTAYENPNKPLPQIGGMAAANIPYDYHWGTGAYADWEAHQGSVPVNQLQAGDILSLMGGTLDPNYGHVVIVKSVSGGKAYVYTQNPGPINIPQWDLMTAWGNPIITGYVRKKSSGDPTPPDDGENGDANNPVNVQDPESGETSFYIRISQDMNYFTRWGMKFQIFPYHDSNRTFPITMIGDVKISINNVDFTPFFKEQQKGKWMKEKAGVYPDNEDGWYDVMAAGRHLTEQEFNDIFSAGMKKITFTGKGIYSISTILDLKYNHGNR